MKTTIEMAFEADCTYVDLTGDNAKSVERLERFEALVRADEAERIAKMCDAAEKESKVTVQQCMDKNEPTLALVAKGAAYQCKLLVAAIRARSIK